MLACRLNVQVCGQLTPRQTHLKFQKGHSFFNEFMGKFNVRVVVINTFSELFQFSLPCIQIKKTSIYGNHIKGLSYCVSRKLVSISSMKIEAHVRGNFLPNAVPNIWC